MISIDPQACTLLQQQAPAAFATTLATLVFDRSLRRRLPLRQCVRPGWIVRDESDDPVLAKIFDRDDAETTSPRTILVHENAGHGFVVVTGRVQDEAETECLLLGDGFALFTSAIFQAGWSDWNDYSDGTDTVEIEDVRKTIAR